MTEYAGKERVAIIFSTYNSVSYVDMCLKSCLSQSYEDLHIIIADDGSTDHTVELLRDTAGGSDRVHIIELPHGERGIARAAAVNTAKQLNAQYLYILDSDMVLKEHLVRDCVAYLRKETKVGGLVIPEIPFTMYTNYYSKVKVFERTIINNAGTEIGPNSIEAARFWRMEEYESTGGINTRQISFEETQPTIRYLEKGGTIKRAVFTGVMHDEKYVTLRNIAAKKKYYFSVMDRTLEAEANGFRKALSRWYFFRPVLYRRDNLMAYVKHPLLTAGVLYMYACLTCIGVSQIVKSQFKKGAAS
ncbi:glycosyltransferase family 2 protein [Paenibacillus sambharensis]|uniref:Glycosyltransferase family 2 protein n=1 Tax=Paenibacillus sambharensis TaxID=1803190 RepID=A0A2W1L9B5_9BACL|nr:glycosyltransferase family 2 protein [Paenibacillus sambharensis]PZD94730.1 glycosyltransferase family 2 protein [Paenibacillus sambharensis]